MTLFEFISYGEFTKLITCLCIDIVEYIIPLLLAPFVGLLYGLIGLSVALYMFGWIGLISAIDVVPGLVVLPTLTINWAIWFAIKHRCEFMGIMGTFGQET